MTFDVSLNFSFLYLIIRGFYLFMDNSGKPSILIDDVNNSLPNVNVIAVIIKTEEEDGGTTKVRYFIFIQFNLIRNLSNSTICMREINVIKKTKNYLTAQRVNGKKFNAKYNCQQQHPQQQPLTTTTTPQQQQQRNCDRQRNRLRRGKGNSKKPNNQIKKQKQNATYLNFRHIA